MADGALFRLHFALVVRPPGNFWFLYHLLLYNAMMIVTNSFLNEMIIFYVTNKGAACIYELAVLNICGTYILPVYVEPRIPKTVTFLAPRLIWPLIDRDKGTSEPTDLTLFLHAFPLSGRFPSLRRVSPCFEDFHRCFTTQDDVYENDYS
jgi:hypothetical protein